MRTFSIITEAHLGLAQANCVFPLANAIELFELCLVNTLRRVLATVIACSTGQLKTVQAFATYLTREVELNGFDANIGGAIGHVEEARDWTNRGKCFQKEEEREGR